MERGDKKAKERVVYREEEISDGALENRKGEKEGAAGRGRGRGRGRFPVF
jgi:hypothetical protein